MKMRKGMGILISSLGLCFLLTFSSAMTGCSSRIVGSTLIPSRLSMAVSPLVATLEATHSQKFSASVSGASDTSVTWKISDCNGSACGTISQNGLYTAPAVIPGLTTVQITATPNADRTKARVMSVTLLPLAVNVPDLPMGLGANEEHQFTATVTRHPNTEVTWSLSNCSVSDCGSIDGSGLYVAPPSVPSRSSVTVTARSKADPQKYDSVTVYNMPIEVTVTPLRTVLPRGAAISLSARVRYDVRKAGLFWAMEPECTPQNCGTLAKISETSVMFTAAQEAPDPLDVTLVAVSVSDSDKTAQARITVSDTHTLLQEGDYAFYFNGDAGLQNSNAVGAAGAGRFHADGCGHITEGLQDLNLPSGVFQAVPFSGSYQIGMDDRGSFEFITAEGTLTYSMTVDPAGDRGRFISLSYPPGNSSVAVAGYFERQDRDAFSLAAMAGPFAFRISSTGREMAAIGRISTGADGKFSDGRLDLGEYVYSGGYYTPTGIQNLSLTGSMSDPSQDTGRGTATFNLSPSPPGGTENLNFTYYILSERRILLVQMDNRESENTPVLGGEMRRQAGNFSQASFNEPCIFSMSGYTIFSAVTAVGRMDPNGSGSITGVMDQSLIYPPEEPVVNRDFIGSYAIEPDGRSEITIEVSSITQRYAAYFFDQNQGFLLQTGGGGIHFMSGEFEPQFFGPYLAASLTDRYLINTKPGLLGPCSSKSSGAVSFSSENAFALSMDVNRCGSVSRMELTGSYDVAPNGRGVLRFDDPAKQETVFWMISPAKMVAVSTAEDEQYYQPALVEYRR
jgi:hypothetical protein